MSIFANINTQMFLTNGQNKTVPAGATYFMPLAMDPGGLFAAGYNILIAKSGYISNLIIKTNSAQPASGSLVISIRINGVDTAVSLTIPANAPAATYQNTINNVYANFLDNAQISLLNNAAAVSAAIVASSALMTFI